MSEHLTGMPTPGPWRLNGPDDFGDYTISPSTELLAVATVVQNGLRPEAETAANAAFIVKAVNAYGSTDALRSALAKLLGYFGGPQGISMAELGRDAYVLLEMKVRIGDLIDARAALSGSPAPSIEGLREWLPIAGAPKDQNIIVAAMNTYSKTWIVGEARWQSDDPDHPDDGDWWWANISPGDYTGDSIMNMNGAVEFWQPLPLPPDAARTALAGVTASSAATRDVLAERARQQSAEGWTPEHDDTHTGFEMAQAAAFYALYTAADVLPHPTSDAPSYRYLRMQTADAAWPKEWDHVTWKKPKDARHNLVRAAALLIAEIERLDRAAPSAGVTAPSEVDAK